MDREQKRDRRRLAQLFRWQRGDDKPIENMSEEYKQGWYRGFTNGRERQRENDIDATLRLLAGYLSPTQVEEKIVEKLNDVEDYFSDMNTPEGTPQYYMISKSDWQALRSE